MSALLQMCLMGLQALVLFAIVLGLLFASKVRSLVSAVTVCAVYRAGAQIFGHTLKPRRAEPCASKCPLLH